MESGHYKIFTNISTIIKALIVLAAGLILFSLLKGFSMLYISKGTLNNFSTIFLSIILEGFPFIIIGSFISSMIQVFISEETIAKVIPKNKFVGVIIASIVGLVFPVCECAIIPIVRRLIKKGLPLSMAVTFMLSVPIINPIVLASTYYAFLGQPAVVFLRAGFGIASAITIGYLIEILYRRNPLKSGVFDELQCECGHEHHSHGHHHEHHDHQHHDHNKDNRLYEIIGHTNSEVYDVGKLFITGALLAATMQTFIPKSYILSIGKGNLSSIIVMMLLAFVLSICSETDAFIARTFLNQFTMGSIIGFLILGPMLDIKNTLMLAGNFKFGFVIKLIFLIISVCFIMAVAAGLVSSKLIGI